MRHPHCCACEAARRRHGVGRGGRRWLDGLAMCTSLLLMRGGQERPLPHFLPHHFPRPGGVNKEPFDRRAIKKAPLNNEGTDHSISQKEPPPPTPPDPLPTHTLHLLPQKKKKRTPILCPLATFRTFSHFPSNFKLQSAAAENLCVLWTEKKSMWCLRNGPRKTQWTHQ